MTAGMRAPMPADCSPCPSSPACRLRRSWINSPPLTPASLRGKVVLVDFWTYSCINCLRTLPYIKAWYEKYKDSGLVIIGVHTPEFPFEKDEANVRKAVQDLGITYPVAMDNDYRHLAQLQQRVLARALLHRRHRHASATTTSARAATTNPRNGFAPFSKRPTTSRFPAPPHRSPPPAPKPHPTPATCNPPRPTSATSEPQNFASPGGLKHDDPQLYQAPADLKLNQWAFAGKWNDERQIATLASLRQHRLSLPRPRSAPGPRPAARTESRSASASPSTAKPPGADHGMDTDARRLRHRHRKPPLSTDPPARSRSRTAPSASSFSTPACRPIRSPSARR